MSFLPRLAAALVATLVFASLIAPPAAARNLQAYGTQPLIRLSANRPAVNVMINGQGPFLFLIDTATSHTILTPQLRERLGLIAMPGPEVDVVTAAGSARSLYYKLAETGTAGVIVEGVRAVVLPLPDSFGVQGALGADFFANFVADLDLRRQMLTLYPEGAEIRAPSLRRLQGIATDHGFIVVPCQVEGIATAAVFDSGAAFTVGNAALASAARRYGIPTIRVIESMITDAIRARQFAEAFHFSKIDLGPASWWDARVLIAGMRVFDQIGLDRKPAIFIGMDLMGGRRVILDYNNASLWLEPRGASS